MIFPEFPKKNTDDKLGICSPSASVGHKLESFDLSLEAICDSSIEVIETESVRLDGIRTASGKKRGQEFNSLVLNDDVKTIISASGGEFCLEILPHLDVDSFIKNPKWVCGASDPTAILYYLSTKHDIATIYGFNAGSFDWRPLHDFQKNALSILYGDIVEQHSFDKYISSRAFTNEEPVLDGDVYWELHNCDSSSLEVSGRLIGGCSDVISMLLGTPYDGTSDFLERYAKEGIIWYFDPFETNPIAFHLLMTQMKYSGYFKNAKAVIIGRIMFPGNFDEEEYIKLLEEDFEVPFVFSADIGHVKPCMTLINGAYGELKISEGKASLKMELK